MRHRLKILLRTGSTVAKVLLVKIEGNFITCIKHDPGMGDADGQLGVCPPQTLLCEFWVGHHFDNIKQAREKSLGA